MHVWVFLFFSIQFITLEHFLLLFNNIAVVSYSNMLCGAVVVCKDGSGIVQLYMTSENFDTYLFPLIAFESFWIEFTTRCRWVSKKHVIEIQTKTYCHTASGSKDLYIADDSSRYNRLCTSRTRERSAFRGESLLMRTTRFHSSNHKPAHHPAISLTFLYYMNFQNPLFNF